MELYLVPCCVGGMCMYFLGIELSVWDGIDRQLARATMTAAAGVAFLSSTLLATFGWPSASLTHVASGDTQYLYVAMHAGAAFGLCIDAWWQGYPRSPRVDAVAVASTVGGALMAAIRGIALLVTGEFASEEGVRSSASDAMATALMGAFAGGVLLSGRRYRTSVPAFGCAWFLCSVAPASVHLAVRALG